MFIIYKRCSVINFNPLRPHNNSKQHTMSSSGWQQLLSITDGELKKANEDTVDELYAFLLTNRITDGPFGDEPNDLKKILGTVQTILEVCELEVVDTR